MQRPCKEDRVKGAVLEVVPVRMPCVNTPLGGLGNGLLGGVDGDDNVTRVHQCPGEVTATGADLEQPEPLARQGGGHEFHRVRGEDVHGLHQC